MIEAPAPAFEKPVNFVFPDIKKEEGEIERVAETVFGGADPTRFFEEFEKRARKTQLSSLTQTEWAELENTGWHFITLGDWDKVAELSAECEPNRDWQDLRNKMQSRKELDAPIVVRKGNLLHKVGGNTRLMVAKALGVNPKVLVVDMTDFVDTK